MNDELEEMNIPYTFDTWDKDVALPQFIGESGFAYPVGHSCLCIIGRKSVHN